MQSNINEEEEFEFLKSVFHDGWDDMDLKIYQILRKKGRLTDTELAEELGTSITTARRRRTKLQDEGYLMVVAQLNLQETEMVYTDVLVEINNDSSHEELEEFIDDAIHNVRIYEVTQYHDKQQLLIRFYEENLKKMNDHINEFLMDRKEIKDYKLLPAARTPKAWNRILQSNQD